MKKIAFFLTALDGGGAEKVMLNLANGFARRGIAVDLLLCQLEGPYVDQVDSKVCVINFKKRLLFSIVDLVAYLNTEKPDALVSAMEDTNIVAILARRFSGIKTKIIATVHNTISNERKYLKGLKRKFVPFVVPILYPLADHVVAVSNGVKTDLENLSFSGLKISVIYNPVVTPDLEVKGSEIVDHPWFNKTDLNIILGVGRLELQKDFSTLIKAFSEIASNDNFRLAILGEGSQKEELKSLTKTLGIDKKVAFLGFQPNPYKYMCRASVFVLSSAWEGFGNVLVESMYFGTTVVSTNCESGPSEILNNGEFGYLVPVGNAKRMSEAIIQAAYSNANKEKLTARATYFSLDKALDDYFSLL